MYKITTAPAAYPVTLAEARAWCRITEGDTSYDNELTILIAEATKNAEHYTGRAFVERESELALPQFERVICLPFPPLLEVVSVVYKDISNVEQTVASSVYELDTISEPGRIKPYWNQFWPVVQSLGYSFNPVVITYRNGYRPAGSPTDLTDNSYLPPELRLYLQQRIVTLFDNREAFMDGRMKEMPRDYCKGILDSLVVGSRLF